MRSSWVIKGSSLHILLKPWNWLPLRQMHLEPMRKSRLHGNHRIPLANSPGLWGGDLGKLQHWILPILLPCPSLVPSLVLHVGCALLTWFRMSWNTWSHWWPGPMWFLGGSSYRFLKFINSKPCPVFISMSLFLTPSSPPLTSGIILPYTMSSKFSWSFPLMSPLSCLSYKCCSNQSLDSRLLPKIFLKWIPSF